MIKRNANSNEYERGSTSRVTTGLQSAIEDAHGLIGDLIEFKVKIVEVTALNTFWAQINEPAFEEKLDFIQTQLNSMNSFNKYKFHKVDRNKLFIGKTLVTLYMNEYSAEFHRAKIIKIDPNQVEVYTYIIYRKNSFFEPWYKKMRSRNYFNTINVVI